MNRIKLFFKQVLCKHHWHGVMKVGNDLCGFRGDFQVDIKTNSWLCCKCAKEGDAYAILGGL